MMKNIVGNWTISGTYTFQSPEYATVQSGVDSNLNGDNAGDRSIINTAGVANAGTGVIGLTSTGQQVAAGSSCSSGPCKNIVAYVAQNANARYVVAGLGALSDAGRNTFPLGRINNFDASLLKRISITERFRMDFGIQTFNVFNHSQFTGGRISDVNFYNTASISRSFLIPNNAQFGQYNLFLPSNSREVQLVAHFIF
jgi:hypothetical protein